MDRIAMQVESSSLLGGGPVMIESVTVIAPRITYEADDPTAVSNLESMKNNAKAHAASSSGMQAASAMRKVVIRNLTVMGGALSLAIPVVDSTLTVPLPPVHLSNIGADTDGATPPEIVRVICEAVADAAKKAVAAAIAKKVDAAVDKLGKIVKRLAKGPPGLLPDPPSLYLPPLDHLRPLPAFPP
ncbi:hypothetical protein CCR94_04635 [Rhodoblastus sphagnicola]|uniref:Uncharacterized protein n=1 Tax=Rhodoblastus sphagnicola TaxID=333368 RepID=A0A2S6NDH5_9HYPH|nr:hypothetical protein CCR94_04635 [Rhodoblastus sphagnicola]